jgi:predicted HicB family RNase H-like nuclease
MADGVKKNKKSRAKKSGIEKEKKASLIRKNTSLRLEQSVLKQLKIRAIEDDTSVQQLLEMLVIDYLRKAK